MPVRLLRETLREDAATAPSAACLDADRLAAWSDGTLAAADRAAAESHAASCARCQAMLAAMAITAPPPAARTWWRTGTYKWLAPLAAAAAAAVLWVAVPRRPIEPPALATRTSPIATTAPAPPEPRAADASNSQRATDLIAPSAPAAVQPQAKPDPRGALGAAVAAPPSAQGAQAQAAEASALRDVAAPPPLPGSNPVGLDALAFSALPAAPKAPAAPPQPQTSQATSNAVVPPATLEEAVGVTPNATESVQLRRERAAAPAQVLAKTSAAAPDIVSPDRNVRWRLRTAGIVERSIDGGLTWQTQATGVTTLLVSGAAPTPTICWVAGRGGIVLRSTDGSTWQRVGLSEPIDLTAIRASDAVNATVTAVDGRTFTTADGGTTWRSR
ncbi:MAG: hypothetical protein JF610_08745 [Acidobacteria bacterium]|nr:hypothetical protein [Acidobacteriota bacterium]